MLFIFTGGLKGLEYVFRVPYRYFVFPISMIIAIFSILTSVNFAKFLDWQVTLTHYLNPPIQLAIPYIIHGHFDLEIEKE